MLSGSGATHGQLKKSIFRSFENAMFWVQVAEHKTNNCKVNPSCAEYIDTHHIDVLEQDEAHR